MQRVPLLVELDAFNVSNIYDLISSISMPRLVLVVQKKQLDIGSLTYRNRFSQAGKSIRTVDVVSYDSVRDRAISGWLVGSIEGCLSGKSQLTLVRKFYELVKMVDSLDRLNDKSFDSCDNLNEAYANYREEISLLKHPNGTSYSSIDSALSVASEIMDAFCKVLNYRRYPVKAIPNAEGEVKSSPTLPPQQNLVEECLSISFSLFSEIFRLLSINSNYPMLLQLPKEKVWVFPIRQFCASVEILNSGKATIERNILWNYHDGKVNTPEEMLQRSVYKKTNLSRKKYFLRREYQKALENISHCNSDMNCIPRRKLMRIGLEAYVVLFSAVTGMNESVLRMLEFQPEWADESFEGERVEVGFRGLKARSGYKVVKFKITNEHIKYFKSFIKLRAMICNGGAQPYLFVAMDEDANCTIDPICENLILGYFRRIKSFLYPSMKSISYRQWRIYKSNTVRKSFGIVSAASTLQHSNETAVSNYMGQSESDSALELSSFLRVYDVHLQQHGRVVCETPAGACEEHGVPKIIEGVGLLEPDCKTFLGCLFCEKFLVHATEKDIRKLLSMKYFLEEILPMARSLNVFQLTAGKTLQRIDLFIDKLKQSSSETQVLVDKVLHEVFALQALSPYWKNKLFFISKLDLI